eukprot:316422_1
MLALILFALIAIFWLSNVLCDVTYYYIHEIIDDFITDIVNTQTWKDAYNQFIFDVLWFVSHTKTSILFTDAIQDHAHDTLLKESVYARCRNYNQTHCPIRLDPFVNLDPFPQQILYCGHRYSKSHLEQYERHCREDGKPYTCPVCRHGFIQYPPFKYEYNPYFYYNESVFYDHTWYDKVNVLPYRQEV